MKKKKAEIVTYYRFPTWLGIPILCLLLALSVGLAFYAYSLKIELVTCETERKLTELKKEMGEDKSGKKQSAVLVKSPAPGTKVYSPLTITGTVESNWLFEGIFPAKLLDNEGNQITTGALKEVVPGSWLSGEKIEFSGEMAFTTTAEKGYLVLEKSNPSGLPENSDSIKIPLSFGK